MFKFENIFGPREVIKEQVLSKKTTDLPEGKIVNVRRSNGEIESDWKIFKTNDKDGSVTVRKINKEGEVFDKIVSQTELRNLNNLENKTSISSAKNFTELFEIIESNGGLQGSKKFYEASELKEIINLVRKEKINSNLITRTEGLRDQVEYLIDQELLDKNKT